MEIVKDEKIVSIASKIKEVNKSWAADIAREMSNAREWKAKKDKPCTAIDVRHIATGKVKSNLKRMLFSKIAVKMYLEILQTKKETENLIEQI